MGRAVWPGKDVGMDEALRRFLSEAPKTEGVRLAQEEVRRYLRDLEQEVPTEREGGGDPKALEQAIRARLVPADFEQEVYGFVVMTAQLRVLNVEVVFRGGTDHVGVTPAVLFRRILATKGGIHTVAFFHTHPSGETWPSRADVEQHQMLETLCQALNLRCVDHLILGVRSVVSFAEDDIV